MIKIGFLVNPIAGMGGAVGLKGTDGDAYIEALRRGAKPVAPGRARRFLKVLLNHIDILSRNCIFITAPSIMGEDYVKNTKITYRIIGVAISRPTTAEDTKRCVREMKSLGVDLIAFVGGDGTARDILDVVGRDIPLLGIPSGVKMYSAVFAPSPEAAAYLLIEYLKGSASVVDGEVMDIDEEAFRRDRLSVKLHGIARTITLEHLFTGTKVPTPSIEEEKISIAKYIAEEWDENTLYIVGPGSTTKAIADYLGLPKTLLGVDVYLGTKVLCLDADESKLLEILRDYKGRKKLILSPIGGQGFILGRGNQQISPKVLSYIDKKDLIIVLLPSKLRITRAFWIDTGDPEIDRKFEGFYKAVIGYREYAVIRVNSASHYL